MDYRSKIAIAAVLLVLSGCADLSERRMDSNVRHPCGNIMDICPGDYPVIDVIARTLNGVN